MEYISPALYKSCRLCSPRHQLECSIIRDLCPNAYGTVTLICDMPGIMNRLSWANINALAFTFSNATAGLGCGAEVQLVDRTTATPVSHWATDPFTFYDGIWTAEIPQPTLPQNHTYDVEFRLHRPQSAVNSCHPAVYAGFLESVNIIY